MRTISNWENLMSSTVQLAARSTSYSASGAPSYGAAVTYRAHISRKRTLVRTASGEQVESGQCIYLSARVPVQPTARLTLSTADIGSTEDAAIHPRILAVEPRYDQSGIHHVVLWL